MVPTPAKKVEKGNPVSYIFAKHIDSAKTKVNTLTGDWVRNLHICAGGGTPESSLNPKYTL